MREIHGLTECPFAWRVRIVAREKDLPFDWLPYDAPNPDPRTAEHNPERKSPKLVEEGFELIESIVICEYLDEAYPGRSLQALGARERAQMRVRLKQLSKLEVHVEPGKPLDRKRIEDGYSALESMLGERPWLGGSAPDLSDMAAWPFLWKLETAGLPPSSPRAAAYWKRARERDSLVTTKPGR
jgi:glutathione S-transferase